MSERIFYMLKFFGQEYNTGSSRYCLALVLQLPSWQLCSVPFVMGPLLDSWCGMRSAKVFAALVHMACALITLKRVLG
jgi:hypothetical protein